MRYLVTTLTFSLLLSGCATMTAEDCTTADWQALGFHDGAKGATLTMADRRANDCAKHGFEMDYAAYSNGRNEGLTEYCTPATAYGLGESGKKYNGVCAQHGEPAFLAAYDRGRELHAFTTALGGATEKLASARSRHDELDARLEKYWNGYRDEGLTMEEHNTMVLELWAERKYLATEAIPYWSIAEKTLKRELDDYRSKVAANHPSVGTNLRPIAFPGPDAWAGPTEADAREMLQEVFRKAGAASTAR